jgi:hypothetical protein
MATLWSIAEQSGDVDSWISRNWKAAGFSSQEDAVDAYERWVDTGGGGPVMIDGKSEDDFTRAILDLIDDPTYVQFDAAMEWINNQPWTSRQKEYARKQWMTLVGYSGQHA